MKILAIQDYLRKGKSLTDLKIEYNLNFYESSKFDSLVVFDYTTLSPKDHPIVREARGLVLEKDTWNIVAKSMNAFSFKNDGSFKDLLFDWEKAKAYPKYDGCLIFLYYYKDQWITGTRFSVDGECNVASAYKPESAISWRDLFIECLSFVNINFDNFISSLDKNKCYSFEICSIVNRNIVIYENKFVKLLSIIDLNTLEEEDIHSSGLPNEIIPYFITVNSLDDVEYLISLNQDPTQNEGLVVVDRNFNRLKFRNPNFERLTYKMNPTDESDSLRQLFFQILKSVSPSSSGTPTVTTYCYYSNTGSRLCLDPSSTIGSGISGPYNSCSSSTDCNAVLYCYYHSVDPLLPTLCIPAGQPAPSLYVSTGNQCGIDPCISPMAGPSSLKIQDQSTYIGYQVCGTSFDPKKNKAINSITTDFVAMCNWIIEEYKKYKDGDLSSKNNIISVWKEAFNSLEMNKPLTSLISLENIEVCKIATNTYISMIKDQI